LLLFKSQRKTLTPFQGVTPALDCNGNAVNQISWYFNLKGSAIDGVFVPISAVFFLSKN